MSSLFATLGTAANSLDVLQQAIGVVQNNVTNATTPGYVTQSLSTAARPFDPTQNSWGGVEATGMQSSRDVYAEQSVWSASQQSGFSNQQSASLNSLQQIFDVSGKSGVPGALSRLYSAFSAWSASPSDAAAQQKVLTAAQGVGAAFAQTFSQAQQISSNTNQQIQSSVSQLNQYSAQIATINGEIRSGGGSADAGLQAQLYNTLEQVSKLAPVTVNMQSDGTATVLLGGQSPLVMGATSYPLTVPPINPAASPSVQILSSDRQDVTSLVNQGTLGAALTFRNTVIPSIIGDGTQQGQLNQLAQGVADRVNSLLVQGQATAGPPPVSGVPLFTYNALAPTGIADSLTVAPNLTGAQLAAINPGPPAVANGIATELASLANPQNPADLLSGFSYTQFYGNIASDVGRQASSASDNATTDTSLLNQAQSLRAQVSGVSLNDQATKLLEFQQAYQASAQLISTVHTIVQSLLQVMQQIG